jgi:hypothetical protein
VICSQIDYGFRNNDDKAYGIVSQVLYLLDFNRKIKNIKNTEKIQLGNDYNH